MPYTHKPNTTLKSHLPSTQTASQFLAFSSHLVICILCKQLSRYRMVVFFNHFGNNQLDFFAKMNVNYYRTAHPQRVLKRSFIFACKNMKEYDICLLFIVKSAKCKSAILACRLVVSHCMHINKRPNRISSPFP